MGMLDAEALHNHGLSVTFQLEPMPRHSVPPSVK